jgi:hypothetical protein
MDWMMSRFIRGDAGRLSPGPLAFGIAGQPKRLSPHVQCRTPNRLV